MRRRLWINFLLIVALIATAIYVSYPAHQNIHIGSYFNDISLRQGLDLKGGVHLVYQADTKSIAPQDVSTAMDGVRDVIENRVNYLGATEPEIRLSSIGSSPSIIVDLPGFDDETRAKTLIGSTAKLEFKDQTGQLVLEGKDLVPQSAQAEPQQSTASGAQSFGEKWEVTTTLTSEGTKKFATATSANIGKTIGIYLDNQLISSPTVQSAITDGKPVITGNFTAQQAKDFSSQLNVGALPVPISLVQEQTVGASLGNDAINQSLLGGLIGIILIFLFIIAYYQWAGLVACIALFVYALLNIAIYKFFHITLTLAGIAGFIISMGIAIDTNILTFERFKEELRLGKPIAIAITEAFRRAWTSIRDSHISGLISATVIFFFGSGSIRGFALVLIIGTLLSLFSAITVTRTWMLLLAGSRFRELLNLTKGSQKAIA